MPPLSTRRLWRNSTWLPQQIFHKTRNRAIPSEPIDQNHAFCVIEHSLEKRGLAGHGAAADQHTVT
jgi:hypothetical protein